jgi:hypothetical protein
MKNNNEINNFSKNSQEENIQKIHRIIQNINIDESNSGVNQCKKQEESKKKKRPKLELT